MPSLPRRRFSRASQVTRRLSGSSGSANNSGLGVAFVATGAGTKTAIARLHAADVVVYFVVAVVVVDDVDNVYIVNVVDDDNTSRSFEALW